MKILVSVIYTCCGLTHNETYAYVSPYLLPHCCKAYSYIVHHFVSFCNIKKVTSRKEIVTFSHIIMLRLLV